MLYRSTLRGSGMYAPARVMTNDEIATRVDTSDAWIVERTGIRRRHIAADEESTSSMATIAAAAALRNAGLSGSDIDLTIVATSTPDFGFPASACLVQRALGTRGGACDLEAACSGFVYAPAMASALIGTGAVRHALVIGSEVFSRVLDWHDRKTCILFGDGAGAVVVSRSELHGDMPHFALGADGSGAEMLVLPVFGSAPRTTGPQLEAPGITMNGPETFKFGVRIMVEAAQSMLQAAGLSTVDVDWLVPHQANQRIITAGAKRLGFHEGQVMSNIEEYGNTSAASIPIAIAEWVANDQVLDGHRMLLIGFGAGLTWGTALVGWRD